MRLARPVVAASRHLLWALLLATTTGVQPSPRAQATGAGVIVGRILDEQGSPCRGAIVNALVTQNDRGTDVLEFAASSETNERGEFRVSGLAPGLYYLSATDPAKDALHYSPTYAPGTAFADEAQTVAVMGTGEPPRVEFRLQAAPPAHVSGQLLSYDGMPLLNGAVTMMPARGQGAPIVPPQDITIMPDGRFTFGRVAPGHYQIRARGQTSNSGFALFAVFNTLVNGRDIDGIRMTLRPGARMDGTVTIESKRHTAPPAFSTLTVRAPFTDGNTFGDVPTGVVNAGGDFAIRGIMTGPHQVVVEGLEPPWTVRQISERGVDITDLPIDVTEREQFHDVRVVVTDASSEVTGTVRDASGKPARKAGVLVFAVAPSFWMHTSRRVRVTSTDDDGRFRIVGLPAGDYLAVASMIINESDLGRRNRLQAYASVATPLTLTADDGQASVDLRLTTTPPLPAIVR